MKEFTEEEIISYADKLLIGLSSEESLSIKEEFKFIDKNIDKINEIPNLVLSQLLVLLIYMKERFVRMLQKKA